MRASRSTTEKTCFPYSCKPKRIPPPTSQEVPTLNHFPAKATVTLSALCAAFACLLAPTLRGQGDALQFSTLPELLRQGTAAFGQGHYPAAAAAFATIRREYAEEPQWTETPLPKRLLPLAGFAAQRSGLYPESIAALEDYFASHVEEADDTDFAAYTLALSYLQSSQREKARDAFLKLSDSSQRPAIAAIARIQAAQLMPRQDGLDLLLKHPLDALPHRVQTQTRLSTIRLALQSDQLDTAAETLLRSPWEETQMPELATLSFLAFELGDALAASHPKKALQAYRIVSPLQTLIQKQESRLQELKALMQKRSPDLAVEQSIWADFYRGIVGNLEHQLASLQSTADYQSALSLRKAICLQDLQRPLEAWLLLEPIALNPSDPLAPEAHKAWFGLARSMQAWEATALIARRYIDSYPDSSDIVEALYWIGQAQLEQERFLSAADTFALLARKSDQANLKASALYLQGFALAMAQRYSTATNALHAAVETAPDQAIAGQASLWIGIIHFLQERWDQAIQTFQAVAQNENWTLLHPEADFRIASCRYAQGEIETALAITTNWIQRYQGHPREAEAQLLHGDLSSLVGDLPAAERAYRAVPPDDRTLRFHAVTALADLLAGQDRHRHAIQAFETYHANGLPNPHVGSFFLAWRQLLLDAGDQTEAVRIRAEAIDRYGNNPQASGISLLIEPSNQPPQSVQEKIAAAVSAQRYTLAARLQKGLADQFKRSQRLPQSEVAYLKLVSDFEMDDLSASCLAAAGAILQEIGSVESETYFNRILEYYPNSEYTSAAFFGLARIAHREGDTEKAMDLLSQTTAPADFPQTSFRAKLLLETGAYAEAKQLYQTLLADRSLDHTSRAETLYALGNSHLLTDEPESAYACFQRVFTLYRSQPDLVASSYHHCARILAGMGKPQDALSVCAELLGQTELSSQAGYQETLELQNTLLHEMDTNQES